MGSSKKHKDRDRDKEHKKKKRRRSRSKSRSRSRERKHRHSDDRRKHREKRTKEYVFDDEEKEREFLEFTEDRMEIKREPEEPAQVIAPTVAPSAEGGENLSLSIDETNRLRAKLGLKPLDLPGGPKVEDDGEPKYGEDVHRPARNLTKEKKTAKVRDKLEIMKSKRKLESKLSQVKTLGESDSEDEGALAWVKKSRKVQQEKQMAEKRAKILQEMDEEFGIDALLDEEFKETKKAKEYSSKDLKGLTVEHSMERFKEGQTVILTLKDKNILDEEEGEALMNVNLADDERYDRNVENKKKKPDYNPYDQPDIDEYGVFKEKDILSKYDEDIDGRKKEKTKFELGSGGKYLADHERMMQQYKSDLVSRGEGLALPAPKIASEYYTEEEMSKFKKVKKKVRKIRKKEKPVKADDLLPLDGGHDLGSRNRPHRNEDGVLPIDVSLPREKIDRSVVPLPGLDFVEDMEVDPENPMEENEILGPEEDLTGVVVDDDAASDLQNALEKTRKLKQKLSARRRGDELVRMRVEQLGPSQEEEQAQEESAERTATSNIMLNATSEFCRSLGEIPTYGQAGNRNEEEEDELLDFEKELMEERRRVEGEEDEAGGTGWQSVEIDTRPVDIKDEETAALDDEPVVDTGIASALKLANKKGYLENENQKKGGTAAKPSDLEAMYYSIEDKRYDDLDEKYSRKRDRFGGGVSMDFRELDTYRPDVKLEYVDDSGRNLNPKEAFRQLSHRFHGKGSGKRKIEKRAKKHEQEQLLKNASSTDTPLGTVQLLREKQKAEKAAFVVLSGQNKLTSGVISKT